MAIALQLGALVGVVVVVWLEVVVVSNKNPKKENGHKYTHFAFFKFQTMQQESMYVIITKEKFTFVRRDYVKKCLSNLFRDILIIP